MKRHNCRWATREEQNTNRASTRWIEHDGLRLTLTQWARRLGIGVPALIEALEKHPLDVALCQRRAA